MVSAVANNAVDLWEAWIDLSAGSGSTLYVVGDICTGRSKTLPRLVKKNVQGVAASHLILEVLAFNSTGDSRFTEVRYTEGVKDIAQYRQVSICAGEEIIAHICDIEIVY